MGSDGDAGGRIAYVSMDSDSAPDRLLVTDLTGEVLARLEHYGKRRRPVGEIALSDQRIAWSVRRGGYEESTAPGSVRTVRL